MYAVPLRRLALLLVLLAAAPAARAAVPEPPDDLDAEAAPAEADTSHFLPPWLHLHASMGIGWISSPAFIRQRYEAGQLFEGGIEARPNPRVRLRLNGEYQVLPAVGRAFYQFVAVRDAEGLPVVDTLSFDWRARGWMTTARLEGQVRAIPHVWLIGGLGRGYLGAGLRAYHFRDPFVTLDIEFPGSSGWAWVETLGARYEFEILGPLLGAELRWNRLDRPQDQLQTWSIRVNWLGR